MPTVLAIDPSLTGTCLMWGSDSDEFEHTTSTSRNAGNSVHQRMERYRRLLTGVEAVLLSVPITAIYIEGYSMGSKGMAITGICEYGGLLRDLLSRDGTPIYEVPPSTLKKFATGKGNSPKDLVAAHLTKRYGVLLESNDEYDAFGIYQLGLMAEGVTEPQNAAQREAVAKVKS